MNRWPFHQLRSHIRTHGTGGPPMVMARATPTMLPVPTQEANPMAKAWKEEIPPPC